MNKMLRISIGIAFAMVLGLLMPGAVSQDARAETAAPPTPPYVKSPGAGTSWSIDMKPAPKKPAQPGAGAPGPNAAAPANGNGDKDKGAAAAPAMVPGIVPVRTECEIGQNKIRRELTTYSDNHKEESFTIKNQLMRHFDGSDKIAVLQALPLFPMLEWLPNGSVYMGTEMIGTKECYKFRVSAEYLQSLNWPADTQCLAWIAVANRFPVQIIADDTLYTFSDIAPFPKNVNLPDAYKVAIEQASRSQRALEMMRNQNVR